MLEALLLKSGQCDKNSSYYYFHLTQYEISQPVLFRKTRGKGVRNKEETELSVFAVLMIVLKKSGRFYRQIRINEKFYQKVCI